MPSTLILDIETVGEDFDAMNETTKESLTRWAVREARDDKERAVLVKDIAEGLGFSPLTGEVVAVGVLDVERAKTVVYFQAPGESYGEFEEDGIVYKQMNEAEMLLSFWNGAEQYQTLVTFNGRGFDVPFLMVRSAIHNIRPTKDFMSNRYLGSQRFDAKHIDLQDLLSFYGSVRRKGSLHLWSRAFGIKSPKEDGVSGDAVARLFAEKKFKEIARYNVRDLEATKELYLYWEKYLKM